jgi:hypothetical protein
VPKNAIVFFIALMPEDLPASVRGQKIQEAQYHAAVSRCGYDGDDTADGMDQVEYVMKMSQALDPSSSVLQSLTRTLRELQAEVVSLRIALRDDLQGYTARLGGGIDVLKTTMNDIHSSLHHGAQQVTDAQAAAKAMIQKQSAPSGSAGSQFDTASLYATSTDSRSITVASAGKPTGRPVIKKIKPRVL